MHFAEVVIRGLYAVEVTLARNRQLVGLLNIGIALDVEQLVAGLPQQPGDGSDVREFAFRLGAVNFDVEARVFVLEEELHSFEDIEWEIFRLRWQELTGRELEI